MSCSWDGKEGSGAEPWSSKWGQLIGWWGYAKAPGRKWGKLKVTLRCTPLAKKTWCLDKHDCRHLEETTVGAQVIHTAYIYILTGIHFIFFTRHKLYSKFPKVSLRGKKNKQTYKTELWDQIESAVHNIAYYHYCRCYYKKKHTNNGNNCNDDLCYYSSNWNNNSSDNTECVFDWLWLSVYFLWACSCVSSPDQSFYICA